MKLEDWHSDFVESLEGASDIDLQRRAWVDLEDPNFPDPGELICQIFDDSGVDALLDRGVLFSETTDAMLRRLSSLATGIDTTGSPHALLASEEWRTFVRQAAQTLALVRRDLAE